MTRNIFLTLIAAVITNCGGDDTISPPSLGNLIVENCVTSAGDASITGNVTLISSTPLTDNSFTIVSITDNYSAIVGTSCVAGFQQNPFAYQVFYNNLDIYASSLYSVSVNILEKFDDNNYYTRDKSVFTYLIITNGNGTTVDMYAYSVAVIN